MQLVLFGIFEKFSDVLFRTADILVKDLGSVDNFGLVAVQNLGNFSGDQSFSSTRRTIQNHSLAVFHAILFNYRLRVPPGVESSSEDLGELFVQTTDPECLEIKIRLEELLFLKVRPRHLDFAFRFFRNHALKNCDLGNVAVSQRVVFQTFDFIHRHLQHYFTLSHLQWNLLLEIKEFSLIERQHYLANLIIAEFKDRTCQQRRIYIDQVE